MTRGSWSGAHQSCICVKGATGAGGRRRARRAVEESDPSGEVGCWASGRQGSAAQNQDSRAEDSSGGGRQSLRFGTRERIAGDRNKRVRLQRRGNGLSRAVKRIQGVTHETLRSSRRCRCCSLVPSICCRSLPGRAADPDFSLIQKLPEREVAAKKAAHVRLGTPTCPPRCSPPPPRTTTR